MDKGGPSTPALGSEDWVVLLNCPKCGDRVHMYLQGSHLLCCHPELQGDPWPVLPSHPCLTEDIEAPCKRRSDTHLSCSYSMLAVLMTRKQGEKSFVINLRLPWMQWEAVYSKPRDSQGLCHFSREDLAKQKGCVRTQPKPRTHLLLLADTGQALEPGQISLDAPQEASFYLPHLLTSDTPQRFSL
jgi:hypothetical protein